MTNELVPFKISSALKNIIGKELITDEFVAVFELVKNSFDANASIVKIIFENQTNIETGKITIEDNGKGMNEFDLKEKWLFVAYSAKNDDTENDDYRNKIKVNRVFAGAKGIGRFSCDRLGKFLTLISVKDELNSVIEKLTVNWQDFEEDPQKEFVNVKVKHQKLNKSPDVGTILQITGLREVWDRNRLLKLKKSLAKLINPNQENDSKNFQIEIIAKSELEADEKTTLSYEKVNGIISNEIFENLKIKTTSINVEIAKNGKTIKTILQDRGDNIYTLIEVNPFPYNLADINFHLFQLNFTAKTAFKRTMGLESVKYGSVFMYKNGFRVYPFGEPGEDLLLIDKRKAQGYNRFLGTRDLIGRIEINGKQNQLKETSSRDGGLVRTETYTHLLNFFEDYVLKRLENYVVNVIKWGDEKIDEKTGELIHPELWPKDVKLQILELITGFIKSEDVISIEYDRDFLNIIENKKDKSVDRIIKNISKIGIKSNNPVIVKEAARIGKVVKEVKADAERDKERANIAESEKEQVKEELNIEKLKAEFYKKQLTPDTDALIHHIKNNNISIRDAINNIIEDIKHNTLDKDSLLKDLSFILLRTNKAIKAASLITHVDLTESDSQLVELNSFLRGYSQNYRKINSRNSIKIDYESLGGTYQLMLSKTELALVIDNLEDNATKWEATHVLIRTKAESKNKFIIQFSDDGIGLSSKYLKNPSSIFQFKETNSKDGTGLGLYVVREILKRMGAAIDFIGNNVLLKGATFQITFSR